MKHAKSDRRNRNDWIEGGFDLIRDTDSAALTVDNLCHHMSRSKGSFYFHFGSMEDFATIIVREWQKRFGDDVLDQLSRRATRKQPFNLNDLAARLDLHLENRLRQLASRYPALTQIFINVDKARIELLENQLLASFNPEDAHALATIEYAAMIGLHQIQAPVMYNDTSKLYARFLGITGRST